MTKITVETTIKADMQKVWDAYTKPDAVTKWNHASDDWYCPKATNDLRVGGAFNYRMEAKDKSFGFDFTGTYTKVVPLKVIEYRMDEKRAVIATFEQTPAGVKVTHVFDAEAENPIDMQKQGWQAILENFKKYVLSV
jgi:uncharacterized protein YndB with AHSA1/START domain